MFDVGGTELLVIAAVALVVIGPKDLPKVLRVVGRYTGKAKAMSRHLRAGFDEMVRQAEIEEMQKEWAEQNRKIMEATPIIPPDYSPSQAADAPVAAATTTATTAAAAAEPAPAPAPDASIPSPPADGPEPAGSPEPVGSPEIAGGTESAPGGSAAAP